MKIEDRIRALSHLGESLKSGIVDKEEVVDPEILDLIQRSYVLNNWFTKENILLAFRGIVSFLQESELNQWVREYSLNQKEPKKVGIIMAGNVPMVGFHDLLSVLISGNIATIKQSSDDQILLPYLVEKLVEIEPRFKSYIFFEDKLVNNVAAVIATGSNNSAKYFEYYFGKYPHIIRKNRNSIGVLTGDETREELVELGKDIFQYFGMGCRNVSKLFLPKGYEIDNFYKAIYNYKAVFDHNKYGNNYNYNRTIYLMQNVVFYENNFLMLKEDSSLHSPIGTIHFEYYDSIHTVQKKIEEMDDEIQCIVSSPRIKLHTSRQVDFGKSQAPSLTDYADGADTLQFLTQL